MIWQETLPNGFQLGADLVLSGAVTREEARTLVSDVRAQLRDVLPGGSTGQGAPGASQRQDAAAGLESLQALLYRPAYEPRPLAQNLCLAPALGATLDQCGSL